MWMQTDGVWGSCHLKTGHPSSSFLWLDVSYWLRARLKLLTRKPIWGLSSMLVSKSQPSFSAAVARMGIAKEPAGNCGRMNSELYSRPSNLYLKIQIHFVWSDENLLHELALVTPLYIQGENYFTNSWRHQWELTRFQVLSLI